MDFMPETIAAAVVAASTIVPLFRADAPEPTEDERQARAIEAGRHLIRSGVAMMRDAGGSLEAHIECADQCETLALERQSGASLSAIARAMDARIIGGGIA